MGRLYFWHTRKVNNTLVYYGWSIYHNLKILSSPGDISKSVKFSNSELADRLITK